MKLRFGESIESQVDDTNIINAYMEGRTCSRDAYDGGNALVCEGTS